MGPPLDFAWPPLLAMGPPVEEVLRSGRHSLGLPAHPHEPVVQVAPAVLAFSCVLYPLAASPELPHHRPQSSNLYPHGDAPAAEATVFYFLW